MIDTIQEVSPRTVILVASIAPSPDPYYGPLIAQFNASVKERVMTRVNRGQHMGYVDTGDLVTSTSEPQSFVQDGYSHENGPVELYPSGFFKEGAGFNLAIDKAVNSGWIPDSLVLNKGPCNSTDPGVGSSSTVPLRVMPTGDSITQGFQSTPGSFGNGYRYELQQRVQNSGQTIDFVGENTDGSMTDPQNEGFSGKEIDYIAGKAIPYAAAARPNVALILAGTNDLGNNVDITGAPARLDTMIGGLFKSAPDATLLVAGIPPSREGDFNSKREAYSTSVRSLVAARVNSGQHIQYVDMNDLNPNADMADDLHPDPSGYKIMGENFAEAIEDVTNRGWVTEPVPAQDTGGGTDIGNCVEKNTWYPQGIITLGNGVGTGPEIRLADLNGDGRDDYLNVHKDGSVHAYVNGGGTPNNWIWHDYGTIAGGVGVAGRNVMFADINGDGRDDYLAVGEQGRVDLHINGGGTPNNWIWYDEGKIADGVSKQVLRPAEYPGVVSAVNVNLDELSFADINGDNRDDYIVSHADTGYAEAWVVGGDPFHPTLLPQGTIAWGTGSGDPFPTFANIDCAGRADYLRANSPSGAVSAMRNNGPIPAGGYSWSELPAFASGDSAAGKLVFADIDGDGRDDYIYLTFDGALVNVYLRG